MILEHLSAKLKSTPMFGTLGNRFLASSRSCLLKNASGNARQHQRDVCVLQPGGKPGIREAGLPALRAREGYSVGCPPTACSAIAAVPAGRPSTPWPIRRWPDSGTWRSGLTTRSSWLRARVCVKAPPQLACIPTQLSAGATGF